MRSQYSSGKIVVRISRGSWSPPAAMNCGYARFINVIEPRASANWLRARLRRRHLFVRPRERRGDAGESPHFARANSSSFTAGSYNPSREQHANRALRSAESHRLRRRAGTRAGANTSRLGPSGAPCFCKIASGQAAVVRVVIIGDRQLIARESRRAHRPSPRARGPTSTATRADSRIAESSRPPIRSSRAASRMSPCDTTSSRLSTPRARRIGRAGTARTCSRSTASASSSRSR